MSDIGSTLISMAEGAAGGAALGPLGAGGGAALALATKLAPQLGKWIGLGDTDTITKLTDKEMSLKDTKGQKTEFKKK